MTRLSVILKLMQLKMSYVEAKKQTDMIFNYKEILNNVKVLKPKFSKTMLSE